MCHAGGVAKMIQVRNVPEKLHRELLRRAKHAGKTLTAYIQEILEREVSHSTWDEINERLRELGPMKLPRPPSEYIIEERRARAAFEESYRKKEQP